MAEFPHCASCRVSIQPGQNVVFRPEGRVQHVACPEVICPVCNGPILPDHPIRRDGEAMLHGNCWMRRARRAARAVAGGADLAAVIRAKLFAGALPHVSATKLWAGSGNGAPCTACGEAMRGEAEYEVEFAKTVSVLFHRKCYAIWDEERTKLPAEIGGGSAASPWTLVFDLGIARRVGHDEGACVELLAAGAEALCASTETRAASREIRKRSAVLPWWWGN